MYRSPVPLACCTLLRFLSPAARLLGTIGVALLMCSCSGGGSSGAATTSSGIAESPSGTAESRPSAPTTAPATAAISQAVANASTGEVRLAWDAVSSPDLAGYRLYYGHTSQTYASTIDVGTQTVYTVPGLSAGQTYYFAVKAYDRLGNESAFSNEVSTLIPATAAAGEVRLAWDAVSSPELAGYRLYYGHTSRTYASTIDVGTQTAYTVSGLSAGQTYYFAVKAYDRLGNESAFSNEVSIPIAATAAVGASSANLTSGQTPVPVAFTETSTPTSHGVGGSSTAAHTDQVIVASALLEIGELTVDDLWQRVTFRQTFVEPIVVATPLSANDLAPATIRIRNVEPTGFEIRMQTWDTLDGIHAPETVSYLAMERGSHQLGTGIRVEAGRLTTYENPTQPFTPVTLRQSFGVAPVVLTAVTSINDAAAVTVRVRNVTAESLQVRLQGQISGAPGHTTETIDYIAWEPSSGTVDGFAFEVHTTPDVVTDTMYTLRLMEHFLAVPMFLAAMQTTNSEEPATLRWDNTDPVSVEIHIQSAASASQDLPQPTEAVGYMAFTSQ